MPEAVEAAMEFVARINRQDATGLVGLMTPDHRLVDAGGAVTTGSGPLEEAWRGYFGLVPDYWIEVDQVVAEGDTVILLGQAGGTYAPNGQPSPSGRWRVPAAWRAVIRDGRVALWQVYADNEPLRALMRTGSPRDQTQ